MDQQPIAPLSTPQQGTIEEKVSMAITNGSVESNEDKERKFQDAMMKYQEELEAVRAIKKELLDVFHKSQDTFEKQLPYIAAGALGLSIGFIKDIVTPIKTSHYKWMLIAGWALLIITLLINLISHVIAGKHAKRGAKETEDVDKTYDPDKINRRARIVEYINWLTIISLTGGIILIVLYIVLNVVL
jgi:hypothetical protein